MAQKVVVDADGTSVFVRQQLNLEDVRDLALLCFGLEIDPNSEVKEVNSYDDRNYIVEGKLKPRGNELDECYKQYSKFILKIFNTCYTSKHQWYENINKIIRSCYEECSPYFKLPFPISGTDNVSTMIMQDIPLQTNIEILGTRSTHHDLVNKHELFTMKDGVCSAKHMVRLLVYVPGKLVSPEAMTEKQAFNYGFAGAVLDEALKKIPPPEVDVQEKFIWNTLSLFKSGFVEKYVTSLKDSDQKKLVHNVLDQFRTESLPTLAEMDEQWVHGDLNDQNIIFSAGGTRSDELVEIIDFDDSTFSYRIVDLALPLMYVTNIIDSPSKLTKALTLARELYRGYTSRVQLSELELSCVYDVMLVRYVLSCCVGTYQYEVVDPSNEYLMTTSNRGWQSLKELVELGKEKFMSSLIELQ